ncbi:MAG TPA: GSCFA domain-containing protein [Chitinophagaceae bacterium]|nr:GSCFA domain-containing protein [Chitinophagaceae bacterium]
MDFMLNIKIDPPETGINYRDEIFAVGSCFTEHISGRLNDLKFPVVQNPNGILFDPLSVSRSLVSYVECKQYHAEELVYLNELWQSWQHHSMFSGMDAGLVLEKINASQRAAHEHLQKARWLIITLGSSFSYQLAGNGEFVANCHRAPAQWFRKHLASIDEMLASMEHCLHQLLQFNPTLNILFTVSPVRHIRDGVIDNNRSKARLIELVHHLVSKYQQLYYFPAYELVIDVLRDYRFYDIDLVHPNYAATEFVFEKFTASFIDEESRATMEDIRKIMAAYRHKPFQPASMAHQDFLKSYLKKIHHCKQKNPHINFDREIEYFKGHQLPEFS